MHCGPTLKLGLQGALDDPHLPPARLCTQSFGAGNPTVSWEGTP